MSSPIDASDGAGWRLYFDAARQALADSEYPLAEDRCRRALAIARATGGADAQQAEVLELLVQALRCQGQLEQTSDVGREWLSTLKRADEPRASETLSAVVILTEVAQAGGDSVRTKRLLRRAGRLADADIGTEDVGFAAAVLHLADVLQQEQQTEEAARRYGQALEIFETQLGPERPEVADALLGLGQCEAKLGSQRSALRHLRRALAIWERVSGPTSEGVAEAADELASVLLEMEHPEEAIPLLKRALLIYERKSDDARLGSCLAVLGWSLGEQGDHEGALYYTRRALQIYERLGGEDDPNLPVLYDELAVRAQAANRLDEAGWAEHRAAELRTRYDHPGSEGDRTLTQLATGRQ
jgi:tetratricopeptide (TPR) repeat protein